MKRFIRAGKDKGVIYSIECVDGQKITANIKTYYEEDTKEFFSTEAAERWIETKTITHERDY